MTRDHLFGFLPFAVRSAVPGVRIENAALHSEVRLSFNRSNTLKGNPMKRLLMTVLAGLTLALPLPGNTAPDETQRQMIQRAQEAKKKLSAAEASRGAERQKLIEEHMAMMQTMMAQMQKAKPRGGMSAEQTREWMDEHLKLMDQLLGQMMDEHHMMMQDMGMRK